MADGRHDPSSVSTYETTYSRVLILISTSSYNNNIQSTTVLEYELVSSYY